MEAGENVAAPAREFGVQRPLSYTVAGMRFMPAEKRRCVNVAAVRRVCAPAGVLLLAAVQMRRQHIGQSLGIEQPLFRMLCHQMIETVDLDRSPLAARLALTRCDRAGVIAVVLRLAGRTRSAPWRHRPNWSR